MKTTIRIDKRLVDEAMMILGVESPSEAVNLALREIVALKFKHLMRCYAGNLDFENV